MPTERPPLVGEVVPNFADRWCRVVSTTDPHGRILGFLYRRLYYSFEVAPQLYSRDWVDSVPHRLHLRKSGSTGNRTRNLWFCSQGLLDHRGGPVTGIAVLFFFAGLYCLCSFVFRFLSVWCVFLCVVSYCCTTTASRTPFAVQLKTKTTPSHAQIDI
jgi:hypothetical protein